MNWFLLDSGVGEGTFQGGRFSLNSEICALKRLAHELQIRFVNKGL